MVVALMTGSASKTSSCACGIMELRFRKTYRVETLNVSKDDNLREKPAHVILFVMMRQCSNDLYEPKTLTMKIKKMVNVFSHLSQNCTCRRTWSIHSGRSLPPERPGARASAG